MQKQKQSFHPAKKITDNQLDLQLKKVKFDDIVKKFNFNIVTNQSWFRQYAKRSETAKNNILKKVVEGIQHHKFNPSPETGEDIRGYLESIKSEISKKQYNTYKNQIKEMEKTNQPKPQPKQEVKGLTRKEKEKILAELKGISQTEQHNGINSDRSIKYRARKNITNRGKENGYKLVKNKGNYSWEKI